MATPTQEIVRPLETGQILCSEVCYAVGTWGGGGLEFFMHIPCAVNVYCLELGFVYD